MKQPNIAIYGTESCPDTTRARRLLDARGVAYEFRDLDAFPEFDDYIAGLNDGKRVIPTIRIDNANFINPADDELIRAVEEAAAERR
jgi:glutaredoxin